MDPTREMYIVLIIAAIFGRVPLMLMCVAVYGSAATQLARYTMLAVAAAFAVAVTGGLAYAYGAHAIIAFLTHLNPAFAWPLGLSIVCAETVLLLPLAIRRVRRTPNPHAVTYFANRHVWRDPDGKYSTAF
jgi:hypothetical protein